MVIAEVALVAGAPAVRGRWNCQTMRQHDLDTARLTLEGEISGMRKQTRLSQQTRAQ